MFKSLEKEIKASSQGIYPEVRFGWEPNLDEVIRSYSRLPQNKITDDHVKHFVEADIMLRGAIDTFIGSTSRDALTEDQLIKSTNKFTGVIGQARKLNFPESAIETLSTRLIDIAFDPEREISDIVREGIATMGVAIGGESNVLRKKVEHISKYSLGLKKGQAVSDKMTQDSLAQSIYDNLGVSGIRPTSSRGIEFIKEKARPLTIAAMAAGLVAVVLTPNVSASAAEIAISPDEDSTSNTAIRIGGVTTAKSHVSKTGPAVRTITESTDTSDAVIITATPEVSTTATEKAIVAETTTEQSSTIITATPETADAQTTVPAVIAEVAEAPDKEATIVAAAPEKTVVAPLAVQNIAAPESNDDISTEAVKITTSPENEAPMLDEDTATPEQLAIQSINGFIKNNEITSAAAFINENFHDKSVPAAKYENGIPVYEITNSKFVEDIYIQQAAFQELISKKGHVDPNYVNNTLTALTVLEALGTDQTVLNSSEVQLLIKAIVRPSDEYQGKLFDQYVAKAKELLGANDGTLLKGFDDKYKAQIEVLYTYALMANVSDEKQAEQIAEIKKAEEAAREAANTKYDKSPESEAIQNLIDRAPDLATKNTYIALRYLMANGGFNSVQAAGVVGNLLAESASTMDPGIHQFGGGPGRGIAQWEGARFPALQRFAADRGTSWDNLDTQLAFILHEMPGRRDTLNAIKGTDTVFDAANSFMVRFETPYVVVQGYNTGDWGPANAQAEVRAKRGQAILNTINGETKEIAAARKAAQAKAAKIEAERKAKEAQVFVDAKMWDDSTGIPAAPGTLEFGNETAYVNGNPFKIGVAGLPNTIDLGKGMVGRVNTRASALAFAMFEQMRHDLGINVVALNDSFRTPGDQQKAINDHGLVGHGGAAAPVGWSNHQSGYAFDINMDARNGGVNGVMYRKGVDTKYPGNKVWEWLNENAAKYHFYQYSQEGWHWSINGN